MPRFGGGSGADSNLRASPSKRMSAFGRGCVKTFFERVRYSKPDWKSRFYAKSTSADVPINFRFNVDAHTSILAKRFLHTLGR